MILKFSMMTCIHLNVVIASSDADFDLLSVRREDWCSLNLYDPL